MSQRFAADSSPFLIAGPCVVESDDLNVRVGEALDELAVKLGITVIYKASYDKANRSRLSAPRGPGIESGLRALEKVRSATGLPILTDIHEPSHVSVAAHVADVLQIPAFLCRQTDLLVAAGKAGRPVNIKKGQWMAPEDMRSFSRLRAACNAPVIFDATHSVQQPGQGRDGSSGGDRGFIPPLLYAAAAAGADGFFLETHPDPARAPSDGPNMVPLDQLASIVGLAVEIWHRVRETVRA